MINALIDGRARGTQMRKLCVDTIALYHVDRRKRPRCALIGGCALEDGPVDTPGRALRRGIRHILKAPIDDRFEPINLRLRLLAGIVPIAVTTPAGITHITRLTDAGAPILALPEIIRLFSSVLAVELFVARRPMTPPFATMLLAASRFRGFDRGRFRDSVA
jgi:hypothetical protein